MRLLPLHCDVIICKLSAQYITTSSCLTFCSMSYSVCKFDSSHVVHCSLQTIESTGWIFCFHFVQFTVLLLCHQFFTLLFWLFESIVCLVIPVLCIHVAVWSEYCKHYFGIILEYSYFLIRKPTSRHMPVCSQAYALLIYCKIILLIANYASGIRWAFV